MYHCYATILCMIYLFLSVEVLQLSSVYLFIYIYIFLHFFLAFFLSLFYTIILIEIYSFFLHYLPILLHTNHLYVKPLINNKTEKVGDPKLMENLEQEISIMRDYLHPNIVQLYEHFSSSRYIYLVLELCPGGDLSKFIKKYRRVKEPIAQIFLRQLSDGLHFLQGKNVIHRDLKPANILLSEFSEQAVLKIADFGFAKHLVEASMAQTPCGSPL